jgi:hypothetical protein
MSLAVRSHRLVAAIAWLLAMALLAVPAQAQTTEICLGRVITTLDFSAAPTLVAGSGLAVGATYQYSNVNVGIDALVRIVALNNGATLATIDNNTAPAAGAPDLRAFFNPELGGVDARSVDFQITFVTAGTSTPLLFDFVATAIDVDGDSGSLREYAEFQNVYAEYLLNNPTNLSVNASAPSAGNTRFESTSTFTAPGIDPTANQNIVATFYSKSSQFNYRIGALGTGNTVRLTSLQFTCPNLPAPVSSATSQDFGDAPASYGNPRHDILSGYRMGAAITAETGPYNNATATADAGDDGVTFAALRSGNSATVSVAVSGASGRLQVWFDWNHDGDFLDPGEQIATNLADNGAGDTNAATGTIGLSFTVPAAAVLGQTFARFRWSTQTGLDPAVLTGHDGEVEDYATTVLGVPILATTKTSAIYAPTSFAPYFIPANDVIYTITTANTGLAATDSNSIFALDSLPPEVEVYVGDFDGGGPATGTILFTTQNGAALTYTAGTDLKFSNAATAPASFASCTYAPGVANAYDPAIRYICVNPKGALAAGSPAPGYTIQFRARIR